MKMLPQDAMRYVQEHALFFARSGPNHPAGDEYQYINKDAKSVIIAYLRAGGAVHIAVANCLSVNPTEEEQKHALQRLGIELVNKMGRHGLVDFAAAMPPGPPPTAATSEGAHGP